jgi:hypothetical protein|tara:strand:+ start:53 stop:352 length:300 start_codon:yes stop_codon:yes gene_type:complete
MSYDEQDYPVGVSEIAKMLSVEPSTVSSWQARKRLPQPDAFINKGRNKLWKTKTIIDWANSTGRNKTMLNYEEGATRVKESFGYEEPDTLNDIGNYKWV